MNRIGDYALIGDCHSTALVGRDGSIDWACFPRFDSPSVFGRILDAEKGGSFEVRAEASKAVSRRYLEDTNVLVTTFSCDGGALEVTDCMPVERLDESAPSDTAPEHSILRRIACVAGEVEVVVRVQPRFEYGLVTPRFRLTSERTAEIVGGASALWVSATEPLEWGGEVIRGDWHLRAGQDAWIETTWTRSQRIIPTTLPRPEVFEAKLRSTISFWREWIQRSWYQGDNGAMVHRSALALKALTYAPTGAVVAAPTTSLPEEIGGIRNWDYRYTWIRDATLTLTSLFILGFREEADDFKVWLERTGAGRAQDLQIMYGISGNRMLPEIELSHLEGHQGSRPVRIGNGAVKQMQLDCYGQLLEAGYLYAKAGGEITPDNWNFLKGLADIVSERWRDPDHGIWEMRDTPRHFVHSKLNCWVALNRAVHSAELMGLSAAAVHWGRERDNIADYLRNDACPSGWFQQASDFAAVDASALLVPALGFLPTEHPTVQATIDKVISELTTDGLVHRYVADDGLEGGEGAFLLCSFWLLDCLAFSNRLDEAESLYEKLLALANDVGLYAEEADVVTGDALGNFPQAFTHMALIVSSEHLSAARRGELPRGAVDYAEVALERLLAAGQQPGQRKR